MPWLRLDDNYADHPKLLHLPRADRWTWTELLLWAARHRTNGHIPDTIQQANPHAKPKLLHKLVTIGLLHPHPDGGYQIHDWQHYNPADPTAAERMRRHRQRKNVTEKP